MDLLERTIHNKKEFYNLALEYFHYINAEEYNIKFNVVSPKSISILLDHDFIQTPCIEIKLELLKDQKKEGIIFFMLMKIKNS